MMGFFEKILLTWRFSLWRFPIFRPLLIKDKEYILVPQGKFKKRYARETIVARKKEKISLSSPKIVYDNGETSITEDISFDFPEISITCLEDIVVSGRTPFLFRDGVAAFPDLVDIDNDRFKVEIFQVGSINVENRLLKYDFNGRQQKRYVESAISLLGECTGNYAHWLMETLPKLLLVDQYAEFKDIPVLVDDWIHPNFIESMRVLGKYDREIIVVSPWEEVLVKNLVCISPPAYIAPDHRDWEMASTKEHHLFTFSKHAFSLLHDISSKVGESPRVQSLKEKKALRKIYMPRLSKDAGNKSRQIINNNDLDEFMRGMQFDFISPADFTFQEQIAIFRHAEIVVSPAGAALSNLFFTKQGCKVVSLSPQYKNKSYESNRHFFNNFMNIMGHDFYFVLGEQEEEGDFTHRRYYANLPALNKVLNCFPL